jgi:lipooligosaccharide transport system ATP-binding protein
MSHGRTVASGPPRELVAEYAGAEAVEIYGPPAKLLEIEREAHAQGLRTRRTGTSISILDANGHAPEGERRATNLEDVFVLLTGEEIS